MLIQKWVRAISTGALFSILAGPALADCTALPSWQALKTAITSVVAAGGNGGLGSDMWGTLVADDGTVCAVAFWAVILATSGLAAELFLPRRRHGPMPSV